MLGPATAALVACGGDGRIPAGDASSLKSALNQVSADFRAGHCTAAAQAVAKAQNELLNAARLGQCQAAQPAAVGHQQPPQAGPPDLRPDADPDPDDPTTDTTTTDTTTTETTTTDTGTTGTDTGTTDTGTTGTDTGTTGTGTTGNRHHDHRHRHGHRRHVGRGHDAMMAGQVLAGRYELGDRLGVGGMSTVVRAFDARLERDVAVKLLAEHLADDSQFVARFRREALSVARLVHPNIVQVFDFGLDEATHRQYIVMELVRGQSGAEILRDEGSLDVRDALSIVVQALRGLEYAHRNGVVHRDVKPGNLLRGEDGVVKLADFGIAKAFSDESSITQVGSVLGTAAYLAPEQAAGEQAGPAADLYALGVVAYQFLSGRLPYEAQSLTELALKQQREMPPRLDELNPEVSPQLAMAVDRALALDPRQRPASADELRQPAGRRRARRRARPARRPAWPARRRAPPASSDSSAAPPPAWRAHRSSSASRALPARRGPRRRRPRSRRPPRARAAAAARSASSASCSCCCCWPPAAPRRWSRPRTPTRP